MSQKQSVIEKAALSKNSRSEFLNANVCKTFAGDEIAGAELEQLNCFTRRKLSADEVFCFSVILCDNEIDRDFERFPRKSLDALAPMFTGKTGVFDHSAQAKNQSARIYRTEVIVDDTRQAISGKDEPYACLKAWAYMVRSPGNEDLILDIDAGIKKEVSVGCAVAKTVCSVCGANITQNPCAHQKAQSYGGVLCHHELCEPTDAYEWSFVAVPAQKNAGVTKSYPVKHLMLRTTAPTAVGAPPEEGNGGLGDMLERIEKIHGAVELSATEVKSLREHLGDMDEIRKAGEEYVAGLRREMLRVGAAAHPNLDRSILEEVSKAMDTRQLKAFTDGFRGAAAQNIPCPQLAPVRDATAPADNQFRI